MSMKKQDRENTLIYRVQSSFKRPKPVIAMAVICVLTLNCFGFCYSKMRFLSDEERIELGVQKALNFYEGNDLWGRTNEFVTNEDYGDSKKYDQIPYKGKAEFFAENPNCCEVSRSAWYSDGIHKVDIYGCLTGFSPYLVSGNFKVSYKVNGKVKVGNSRFVYRISSCGKLRYPEFKS